MKNIFHTEVHEFDVCVVGGGMAGLCAAIASARNGARTAIVQDRPVFGGNASSEIRMWICGAHGPHNKETGLLEELQLENLYLNPTGNYSIWDAVLWNGVNREPRLTKFLNCSCTSAEMDGNRIVSISAWQLTTQTWHRIAARQFIDCSGDSILAAVTGADYRTGREARSEHGEDIQPQAADKKTMGNSLLIQLRRTDDAQPFVAPDWAWRIDSPEDLPCRIKGVNGQNFWWLEIGGLQDTIRDAESIRDDLMRLGYGVWDYIKNRAPERSQAENWALEWIGSLPGKRENRRCLGDHILTQNDIQARGNFHDTIAYGGWSMDDHHPAGIFFPGRPTIFHPAPSPYGIPYRCLYSRNIDNLLFAGRNISATHAALSSTRVMGTCAILGQAAGTAAALCVRSGSMPRGLCGGSRLEELQRNLMEDDCWLPGRTRPVSQLAMEGSLTDGSEVLRDGMDRDREDAVHHWKGQLGTPVGYEWSSPVQLRGARIVFDSNLQLHKRMPCSYPHREGQTTVPGSLIRRFRIEIRNRSAEWETIFREENNYQRLVIVPLAAETSATRIVAEETWGDEDARIFSFEPLEELHDKQPPRQVRASFSELRSRMPADDLAPPPEGDDRPPLHRSTAA